MNTHAFCGWRASLSLTYDDTLDCHLDLTASGYWWNRKKHKGNYHGPDRLAVPHHRVWKYSRMVFGSRISTEMLADQ